MTEKNIYDIYKASITKDTHRMIANKYKIQHK